MRLRICYHNHAAEFANNGAEIEALVREIDSDVVRLIVDVADATHERADVAGFFAKYHKRIDGFHIRESDKGNDALASAIKKAKWTGWVIAEEDKDSAAKPARENIRKVFGV